MAGAALVALTWAAAAAVASAVRYMDYSGVKMPQYGPGDYESARETAHVAAGADDYHGRSPDASASLDYKFEEDAHGKSEKPVKETDDRESWSKFARRQRELERLHEDETLETLDKYDPEPEAINKEKFSRRLPIHRSRLKSRKSQKDDLSYKRSVKYNRGRSDRIDTGKDYFQPNSDDIPDDNGKEAEEVVEVYGHTPVTERIIRRKPRDRFMRGGVGTEGEMPDVLEANRRIKPERRNEPEYVLRDEDRPRPTEFEPYQPTYRPVMEPIDDTAPRGKLRSKSYGNYGDYYDMKRVHNIKNKLPLLLRRTSARVTPPTVSGVSKNTVLDALWTRRSNVAAAPQPALAALSVVPLPPTSVAASTTSSTELSTRVAVSNASGEISLAEKSRLSILKKAQRKESLRSNTTTLKPPVLLQVTDKLLTVVMVEPPSSEGPWMRAREVTNDSPERVERAKRLMRRKIVARAKNIQELTDNWDEMICDYIDVSLLDCAPRPAPLSAVLGLVLLAL